MCLRTPLTDLCLCLLLTFDLAVTRTTWTGAPRADLARACRWTGAQLHALARGHPSRSMNTTRPIRMLFLALSTTSTTSPLPTMTGARSGTLRARRPRVLLLPRASLSLRTSAPLPTSTLTNPCTPSADATSPSSAKVRTLHTPVQGLIRRRPLRRRTRMPSERRPCLTRSCKRQADSLRRELRPLPQARSGAAAFS